MHPVLKHLIDNNFSDLNGSRIEGTLAVSDDLVNLGLHELIAQVMAPAANAKTPTPATPAPYDSAPEATEPAPDPQVLLRKLNIEKLQYRTEAGRTVLEIACGIKQ